MNSDQTRSVAHTGAHAERVISPYYRRRGAFALCAAIAAFQHHAEAAQTQFNPYASVDYSHNSNVFAVPNQFATADSALEYIAGLAGTYSFSRQLLTFTAEGRRFDYNRYSDLDHNESLLRADLAWAVGSNLDGDLSYSTEKRLEPFTDRVGETDDTLLLERESIAAAQANLRIGTDWRLETGLRSRELDSPQQQFSAYGLRENSVNVGFKYIAIAHLSFGLEAVYLDGKFHGADLIPNYSQTTVALAANYRLSGFSTISASIGHTQRDVDGGNQVQNGQNVQSDNQGGVTGALNYERQLTGKTRVNIGIYRNVNSYIATGTSQIDTGGSAGVEWNATRKLLVSAQFSRTHSDFSAGTPTLDPTSAGRSDNYNNAGLSLKYSPRGWLSIRLTDAYQQRASSVPIYRFTGNMVELYVQARLGPPPLEAPDRQ